MSTSLKTRLRSAVLLDAGLMALLASGSPAVLRWYDEGLAQGTAFPAVTVQTISDIPTYCVSGRLPTGFARLQFNVYGTGNDTENANAIVAAMASFFDQFSGGTGVTGKSQYSNLIVANRDGGIANTQPPTYMRLVDANIFWNDSL